MNLLSTSTFWDDPDLPIAGLVPAWRSLGGSVPPLPRPPILPICEPRFHVHSNRKSKALTVIFPDQNVAFFHSPVRLTADIAPRKKT